MPDGIFLAIFSMCIFHERFSSMCTPRDWTELTICCDERATCKLVHVRKPLATQVTIFFIIGGIKLVN